MNMAFGNSFSVLCNTQGQVIAPYGPSAAGIVAGSNDREGREAIASALEAEFRKNATWYLAAQLPVAVSALFCRTRMYLLGYITAKAEDFQPHVRQLPGMLTLPAQRFTLDGHGMKIELERLYLTSLGEMGSSRPPAHCHPMAMLVHDVLIERLMAWDGEKMMARQLEMRLSRLINEHEQLGGLWPMTMITGELPTAFPGYVIDVVERILKWFVGPSKVNGPREGRVERRAHFSVRDCRRPRHTHCVELAGYDD